MKEKLLSRIAERKITVGVVGLGYVGLPLAVEKAKAGFRTIGFDVQEEKVKLVNAGTTISAMWSMRSWRNWYGTVRSAPLPIFPL